MTKRKASNSKKQSPNTTIILAIVALAVVVLGGMLFASTSATTTSVTATIQSERISANDYVNNFADDTSDHILIDVRTPEEFASGHIAGAINISVQELEQRLSEVPDDKNIVVYCRSGNRSATASNILTGSGYDGVYDMGGIIAWQQAGLPVE